MAYIKKGIKQDILNSFDAVLVSLEDYFLHCDSDNVEIYRNRYLDLKYSFRLYIINL